MEKGYDFKKEWPKIKNELIRVSKDAMALAQKGEEEVIRFSKKGKLHIDVTAIKLKEERLYNMIGKEYIKAKCPSAPTDQLKKLIAEWKQLEKEMKALNRKIKAVA